MFTLNFGVEWEEQEANGEICDGCKDIIVGKVYIPFTQIGKAEELDIRMPGDKVCHDCYVELRRKYG